MDLVNKSGKFTKVFESFTGKLFLVFHKYFSRGYSSFQLVERKEEIPFLEFHLKWREIRV